MQCNAMQCMHAYIHIIIHICVVISNQTGGLLRSSLPVSCVSGELCGVRLCPGAVGLLKLQEESHLAAASRHPFCQASLGFGSYLVWTFDPLSRYIYVYIYIYISNIIQHHPTSSNWFNSERLSPWDRGSV